MESIKLSRRHDVAGRAAAASLLAAGVLALSTVPVHAQLNSGQPQLLSTGQIITPLAPAGARFQPLYPGLKDDPSYSVGQAVTTVVSPDKKTLLILTSGFNAQNFTSGPNAGNQNDADSTEFVFVFDITGSAPVQKQAIPVPNTFSGIAFNPNGTEFYVSGGDNDNVHVYDLKAGVWAESGTPVALGHLAKANPSVGNSGGLGLQVKPESAGIAITKDGSRLVVANYENDSISVLTPGQSGWVVSSELDLRPGIIDPANAKGTGGGEYPVWVTIKNNDTAYVSSIRDRQIVVVSLAGAPQVTARIPLPGNPNRMVLKADGSKLYVAQDNSDSVAVINTASNTVEDEIKVTAPVSIYPNKKNYKGAIPNSVTLSPDEKTLYVTNGGENAVAVVRLSDTAGSSYVAGLIPTGFYPNSISTSADGKSLYIVNGKSATGPNPLNCQQDATVVPHGNCNAANQYTLQLTKAGFQTVPTPDQSELNRLTDRVATNDHLLRGITPEQEETLEALRGKIKHVVYIVKENRTYDQVLGDLEVGNGDPSLTQFPEEFTPNFHAMARNFVTLDNFSDTSNVSFDGWSWSTAARTTDIIEKEYPVNYAGRGVSYDSEGTNRNINVGYATLPERLQANPLTPKDPDQLPGLRNAAAPDAPDGEETAGYIWNAALKAKLTVRNYGFFIDLARYHLPAALAALQIPALKYPATTHTQVAYSTNATLRKKTDPYFRGFDNVLPDYYRFKEWEREFNQYAEGGGDMPNLTLLRLMHDHFGNFSTALDKVNTPELQIADNDYAVGRVIERIAHSRFRNDTLIFVIEDDSQDGPDHVDAHRSTAFVVGPYVKQKYVDSRFYTTVSMLRTIEDILGTEHLSLNDASAAPMADVFDTDQKEWHYKATASAALKATTLPIPPDDFAPQSTASLKPLHGPAWWAAQTKGMNFSVEDRLDTAKFNRVLWRGTMGNAAYPTRRSGQDLRANRQQLLERSRQSAAGSNTGNTGVIPGSAD